MRVVMVEPQGQGGICHYSYSLCSALSEAQSADVTLATASPYELAEAPQPFGVMTAFGPSLERKAMQWLLGRQNLQQTSQSFSAIATSGLIKGTDTTTHVAPYAAASLAGRASRWLAIQEIDRGWRRVLSLVRRKQPVVAHIQWLTNPERDRQWVDMLRAMGVPVVLTAHNILPHDAPSERRETWAKLYAATDAIIVHYQRGLDELEELGIERGKASVIPLGNFSAIQALTQGNGDAETRRNSARQRLGFSSVTPIVLSFGFMRPYKGLQYLLAAFAMVRQTLPEARLILAGRAPDGFAAVQAEIDRLGLGESTLAFPTYLTLKESADLFEACDVVALPYVEATQSAVVQLAYAYSRPVVATHVGGIPEAVIAGQSGVLVAPRDSCGLADAVLALLRDREECARLGRQARQFALDQFAWEPIARQTIHVYERARGLRTRPTVVATPKSVH